jgi:(1->4)-alpha-D-glucan 1-alpha-D-glucosylmutase
VERGRRNSLAQTVLLLTCPGSPDLYQGDELWNFSLVDPDNRRPVDYHERRRLLAGLGTEASVPIDSDERGTSKLRVVQRLLALHGSASGSLASADYEPLPTAGCRADDVVGFRRGTMAIVVPCTGDDDWGDTTVELPADGGVDVVTGEVVDGGRCRLAELFAGLPVAVVHGRGS